MSWLKRIEPVIITQTSEVPFVIKEDGVLLCFDNFYFTNEIDHVDHYIKFTASKVDMGQQSTNCLYFKTFPQLIPFDDIIVLNDIIAQGRIIKNAAIIQEKPRNILLAKSAYLHEFSDDEFQEFVETIDDYDEAFLLIGEEIEPQDRILEGDMHIVSHSCWYKTCVTMLDKSMKSKSRKYCWTKAIPEISITIYGAEDGDECGEISSCLENIGITEKEITWG